MNVLVWLRHIQLIVTNTKFYINTGIMWQIYNCRLLVRAILEIIDLRKVILTDASNIERNQSLFYILIFTTIHLRLLNVYFNTHYTVIQRSVSDYKCSFLLLYAMFLCTLCILDQSGIINVHFSCCMLCFCVHCVFCRS